MAIWCTYFMIFLIVDLGVCRISSASILVLCIASLTLPLMTFRGSTIHSFASILVATNGFYLSCLLLMTWLMIQSIMCVREFADLHGEV